MFLWVVFARLKCPQLSYTFLKIPKRENLAKTFDQGIFSLSQFAMVINHRIFTGSISRKTWKYALAEYPAKPKSMHCDHKLTDL